MPEYWIIGDCLEAFFQTVGFSARAILQKLRQLRGISNLAGWELCISSGTSVRNAIKSAFQRQRASLHNCLCFTFCITSYAHTRTVSATEPEKRPSPLHSWLSAYFLPPCQTRLLAKQKTLAEANWTSRSLEADAYLSLAHTLKTFPLLPSFGWNNSNSDHPPKGKGFFFHTNVLFFPAQSYRAFRTSRHQRLSL